MGHHAGARSAGATGSYRSPSAAVAPVRWAVGVAVTAAGLSGVAGLVLAAVLGWAAGMAPAGMGADVTSPNVSAAAIGLLGTVAIAVSVTIALTVVAVLGGSVTVIRWQSVALRNLPALEVERPFLSVRAAAAAWFVPVWGLIAPWQVLTDLWRSGDLAEAERPERPGRPRQVPRPLTAWWVAWVLADLLSPLIWLVPHRSHTFGAMALSALLVALLNGVLIVGGLALVRVLRQISRRQDARFRALRTGAADGATQAWINP